VERRRRAPRGAVRGPDDRGAAGLQLLHGDFLLVAHASYPFSSSARCSIPFGFGPSVSSAISEVVVPDISPGRTRGYFGQTGSSAPCVYSSLVRA
jgi:hypothetical protein